jgi:hypothetical protein
MTLAVAPAAVLAAATEVWLKAEEARMENKKDRTREVTFLIRKQFWFEVLDWKITAADKITMTNLSGMPFSAFETQGIFF